MIITIDGPAGAGKSTVAKKLAQRCGFHYLDTGAMYRTAALYFLKNNIPVEEKNNPVHDLKDCRIDFRKINGEVRVFLNDADVTLDIRAEEVTKIVSLISQSPEVRSMLVEQQRRMAEKPDMVVEGRDIGSVVFPDAGIKFYLDADPGERALRRARELNINPESEEFVKLKQDISKRDETDSKRELSPLIKARDAVMIDSTTLSQDEVVEKMYQYVNNKRISAGWG